MSPSFSHASKRALLVTPSASPRLEWLFVKTGERTYKLVNRESGRCMGNTLYVFHRLTGDCDCRYRGYAYNWQFPAGPFTVDPFSSNTTRFGLVAAGYPSLNECLDIKDPRVRTTVGTPLTTRDCNPKSLTQTFHLNRRQVQVP